MKANEARLLTTIDSVAEAFFPSLSPAEVERPKHVQLDIHRRFCSTSAVQLTGCSSYVRATIAKLTPIARSKLLLLLRLLGTRVGSLLLCGTCVLCCRFPFVLKFSELPVATRQHVLLTWASSPITAFRQYMRSCVELLVTPSSDGASANSLVTLTPLPHLLHCTAGGLAKPQQAFVAKAHKGLRNLVMLAVATWTDTQGGSFVWDAMGYPGPQAYVPASIHPAAQAADRLMEDVVVNIASLQRHGEPASGYRGLEGRGGAEPLPAEEIAGLLREAGITHVRSVEPPDDGRGPLSAGKEHPSSSGQRCVVQCDAVVVGSGAGGGPAAALLTKAGLRVIVIEKGQWLPTSAMNRREREALQLLFEDGGLTTTASLAVSVMAGSGLGGGTRLNWCASFRTPDHVREEWARDYGLTDIAGPEYTAALDAVCSRLGVHEDVTFDGQAAILQQGMEALGGHVAKMPRNCPLVDGCQGLCTMGCASGHKQDTVITWLADAAETGVDEDMIEEHFCPGLLRIITGAEAHSILLSDASAESRGTAPARRPFRAQGVLVKGRTEAGHAVEFEVHCQYTVSSAGALHTPALLLRSGIKCRGNVGKHLRLHPATLVGAVFPAEQPLAPGCHCGPVRLWEGVMMGAFSRQVAQWDKDAYGALLSVPQMTTGLFAALLPWQGPVQYRQLLMQYPYVSHVLSYTRDRGYGRVSIDRQGTPVLHYWPCERTRQQIVKAVQLSIKAVAAAGAQTVYTHHVAASKQRWELEGPTDPAILDCLQQVEQCGILANHLPLYSAHQMGSCRWLHMGAMCHTGLPLCRMGSDASSSAVDPWGECWEVENLFVADASLFPTACGVNPMVTASALSYFVITRLLARVALQQQGDKESGAASKTFRGRHSSLQGTVAQRRPVAVGYEQLTG